MKGDKMTFLKKIDAIFIVLQLAHSLILLQIVCTFFCLFVCLFVFFYEKMTRCSSGMPLAIFWYLTQFT